MVYGLKRHPDDTEVVGLNTYRFEKHCWAEIDLDALCANYAYIRRRVGGPVCAVIKADAYGHGAVAVARALAPAGAAGFAVSCLSEARHLRRHGITLPVMILGYTSPLLPPTWPAATSPRPSSPGNTPPSFRPRRWLPG